MTITGVLSGIFIANEKDSLVSRRVPSVRVLENGLEGDKHTGWFRKADVRAKRYPKGTEIWNSRQISIVSEEELELIAEELCVAEIKPEWLGANLCLRGVFGVSCLQPRTKLFIPSREGEPEVGLYVTAVNKPCIGPGNVIKSFYPNMGKIAEYFSKAAMGKRGLVAVVEHGGFITEGATVAVVYPD